MYASTTRSTPPAAPEVAEVKSVKEAAAKSEFKLPPHKIATLSKNVAQHCGHMSVDEWCASIGSIHTCGLSIDLCQKLGITHLYNVNDMSWSLPKKIIHNKTAYQPTGSFDDDAADNGGGGGGVHQGSSDCDINCRLDAAARAHMKIKLHKIFNKENNITMHDGSSSKDEKRVVELRKKQHRKSAVLLRSLAHLLATGQEPTIGVMVRNCLLPSVSLFCFLVL